MSPNISGLHFSNLLVGEMGLEEYSNYLLYIKFDYVSRYESFRFPRTIYSLRDGRGILSPFKLFILHQQRNTFYGKKTWDDLWHPFQSCTNKTFARNTLIVSPSLIQHMRKYFYYLHSFNLCLIK